MHINTVEAEFSVLKPWLATFRGVSKERLYLYTSHYEFLRNHRGAIQAKDEQDDTNPATPMAEQGKPNLTRRIQMDISYKTEMSEPENFLYIAAQKVNSMHP